MLYNRNWDKPKHKPLSMKAVIAWLETKDPGEEYNYMDYDCCLAAQYNASIGREYAHSKTFRRATSDNPLTYLSFDRRLERISIGSPSTFGAALKRARG